MVVDFLCRRYGALSPIKIQNEPFSAVISLYADIARQVIRENNDPNKPDANGIIRRPAGDDWY
jgi:hypothetical protein